MTTKTLNFFQMKMTVAKSSVRVLSTGFVALALAFGSASCANNKADTADTATTGMSTDSNMAATDPAMTTGDAMGTDDTSGKNLAENATAVPQMSTLTAALTAAGLADKASSGGPYTVFAPTNDAFDALPAGTLDDLLKPENKAKLTDILTYHVVPGSMMAADLKDGQELTTIEGKKLKVSVSGSTVTVNGANVVKADVKSSNGVTHVIDKVLLPQ